MGLRHFTCGNQTRTSSQGQTQVSVGLRHCTWGNHPYLFPGADPGEHGAKALHRRQPPILVGSWLLKHDAVLYRLTLPPHPSLTLTCPPHPSLTWPPHPAGPQEPAEALQSLVSSSGKLELLDRLMGPLQQGGHRVLIYSQFTRTLDLLEEWLQGRQWGFCRIDGTVAGGGQA